MPGTTIIWDWNGTLLNDLGLCLASINALLEKRSLPLLDRNSYKEVFSFPVKNYYAAIGFDFDREDFEVPAKEFIDLYNSGLNSCALHPAARDVLSRFKTAGARQFVLSAMQQSMLTASLKHNRILHFFEGIAGLDDHYAVSKIDRGRQLIREYDIEKENAWMVGDTDHDFEVAEALGIRCILVADGHQSAERLRNTGAVVVENLDSLLKRYPFF
jgi:phosphoglycolate phosphatase